jgi:hypothetical protein
VLSGKPHCYRVYCGKPCSLFGRLENAASITSRFFIPDQHKDSRSEVERRNPTPYGEYAKLKEPWVFRNYALDRST